MNVPVVAMQNSIERRITRVVDGKEGFCTGDGGGEVVGRSMSGRFRAENLFGFFLGVRQA